MMKRKIKNKNEEKEDKNKYKPPVSKLHGDGVAAPLISP